MSTPGLRNAARAYVRLPVQVAGPSGAWSGRTRDLSRGGTLVFVEPPYPAGRVTVTLDLPGGPLAAEADVRFTIPGVGVGLQFTSLAEPEQARVNQVVDAASATFGLWGIVGKYLNEGDARVPLTLPRHNDSVFAELRASLGKAAGPTLPTGELAHHVMHPVGENGAAYRLLFRRPGSVTPAESDLAGKLASFERSCQGRVKRVAAQDVLIKLHAGSQPKPYRVVELVDGGHAAVVVSESTGAPPRISFLTLGLGETLAISLRGTSLYPHFTDEELDVIRMDSVRGQPGNGAVTSSPGAVPAPVDLGAVRARFSDWALYDENNQRALVDLLRQDNQAEVRKYGTRTVTLHPHVLMRVRTADGAEHAGVPMYDGRRYCVLQVTHEGFGRVFPLGRDVQFSVLVR